MTDYEDRKNELQELALLDKSMPYETDESFIGLDSAGKFVLLVASGNGEFKEQVFSSLDEMEFALIYTDQNGNKMCWYSPSIKGSRQLLADARAKHKILVAEAYRSYKDFMSEGK